MTDWLRQVTHREVPGIAVALPLRPDRPFCQPVLWRLDRKKGAVGCFTIEAPRNILYGATPITIVHHYPWDGIHFDGTGFDVTVACTLIR